MVNKKTSKKKLPICPWCQKGFFDCLMVDDEKGRGYHLDCLELKKEKESSPLLFAKVERLENEIIAMRSEGVKRTKSLK